MAQNPDTANTTSAYDPNALSVPPVRLPAGASPPTAAGFEAAADAGAKPAFDPPAGTVAVASFEAAACPRSLALARKQIAPIVPFRTTATTSDPHTPRTSISQNPHRREPAAAPIVLSPYSLPTRVPTPERLVMKKRLSIGSVAPIHVTGTMSSRAHPANVRTL